MELNNIIEKLASDLSGVNGDFECQIFPVNRGTEFEILIAGTIWRRYTEDGDGIVTPKTKEVSGQGMDIYRAYIQFDDFEAELTDEACDKIEKAFII